MNLAEAKHGWLQSPQAYVSLKHEGDKVIAFERGGLLFIFNFHAKCSFENYRIGVQEAGCYTILLDSDAKQFGGHGRLDPKGQYFTFAEAWCNRANYVQVYIPSRTALVLEKKTDE